MHDESQIPNVLDSNTSSKEGIIFLKAGLRRLCCGLQLTDDGIVDWWQFSLQIAVGTISFRSSWSGKEGPGPASFFYFVYGFPRPLLSLRRSVAESKSSGMEKNRRRERRKDCRSWCMSCHANASKWTLHCLRVRSIFYRSCEFSRPSSMIWVFWSLDFGRPEVKTTWTTRYR